MDGLRDVLLPAALFVSAAGLSAAELGILLLAWVKADRDGLLWIEPEQFGRDDLDALEAHGLLVVYPTTGALVGRGWCGWLPDVAAHPPPPSLRRDVGDASSPSPLLVHVMLARRLGREPTTAECRSACPRAYGRKRAASTPTDAPEEEVFRAWASYRAEGDALSLGPAGRRSIAAALKELGGGPSAVEAMVLLFEYVFTAPDTERGPKWLRDNGYLGIDNLTVLSKLQGRADAARRWKAKQDEPPLGAGQGVDLGPLGLFRRRTLVVG